MYHRGVLYRHRHRGIGTGASWQWPGSLSVVRFPPSITRDFDGFVHGFEQSLTAFPAARLRKVSFVGGAAGMKLAVRCLLR